MEHPTHWQRHKPVIPGPLLYLLRVKIYRALWPCSCLPKFKPAEPIDEAVVAHVPIPDELLDRHAPRQSIVARQVGLLKLCDGVFGVFKMKAVVNGSHASEEQ